METRPRTYPAAKAPPTTEQRVTTVERKAAAQAETIAEQAVVLVDHADQIEEQGAALDTLSGVVDTVVATVDGLPPTDTIWSDSRPTATFGTGSELTWTATGNGSSTTFSIPGRLSTNPARYVVILGGIRQAPSAFSLPTGAETIVFASPPPADVAVAIHAPFYGASS